MTEEQFFYLYANANSIAELALREIDKDMENLLQDVESLPATELGSDATSLDSLNWDALDGLNEEVESANSSLLESDPALLSLPDEPSDHANESDKDSFDIASYIQNAYEQARNITSKIDSARAKANLEDLRNQIESLPKGNMEPLDKALSGAQLQDWLNHYHEGLMPLFDLVADIRSLDMD